MGKIPEARIKKPKLKFASIVALILVFCLYFHHYLFFLVVSGESMEPTFYNGKLLLFSKNTRNIKTGDIVAFSRNGELYIKRVTGSPGDVYFSNQRYPKNYLIFDKTKPHSIAILKKYYQTNVLARDSFYVEGDNKLYTTDSNSFGPIKRSQINGSYVYN